MTDSAETIDQKIINLELDTKAALDTKITMQDDVVTVTVGPGGDFQTVAEAFGHVIKFAPASEYINGSDPFWATITLKSGFVWNETLELNGLSLYGILLDSEDAIVYTAPGLTGKSMLIARSSGLFIDILLDHIGVSAGVFLSASVTWMGNNEGLINSSGNCLKVESGIFRCGDGCDFSGGDYTNVLVDCGASVALQDANLQNGGSFGVQAQRGSYVEANDSNATGCPVGFKVFAGSTLAAKGATGTLSQLANTATAEGLIFQ